MTPEELRRLERIEAQVASLAKVVGIELTGDEQPEAPGELEDSRLARGFGRYREKVHALEEERRRR